MPWALSTPQVYRGIGGGLLPEAFWQEDKLQVRGGCEYGFMSCTFDRSVAVGYAGTGAATVLELEMGYVDKGADIAFLSQ